MPRKIVSKKQARLAGMIAAGYKPRAGMMGFQSAGEARDVLRGTKVRNLPERWRKK